MLNKKKGKTKTNMDTGYRKKECILCCTDEGISRNVYCRVSLKIKIKLKFIVFIAQFVCVFCILWLNEHCVFKIKKGTFCYMCTNCVILHLIMVDKEK